MRSAESKSVAPERGTADLLSDVLQQVQLSGAVFFDVDARAPWVADAPPARDLAAFVMPGAQHVIAYHVVVSGTCWLDASDAGDEPIALSAGTVVLFPQGDRHVLSSEPGLRAEFDHGVFDRPRPDDISPFMLTRSSDGPEATRLICGFLGCDALPFNPLLQSLPRMVVVADGYQANDGWLRRLLDASMAEIRRDRTGGRAVLSRLSELVFIETIRIFSEQLPPGAGGWLDGLRDPHVGRAISLIHAHPARTWTLASLAREAGVSRTVLAETFKDILGLPPMTYLARWRMQLASRLLAGPDETLAGIASEVGYGSEASFSRAFKRCTGMAPAAWRHTHHG